jgi:ribosomal protein S18 acetylase RimI-like enzyme
LKAYGDRRQNESADAVRRISRFLGRALELTADTVKPVDGGRVALTPSLPEVWGLNHLQVDAQMPWTKAVKLADEHLAELPYRHLVAENELGRALVAPLRSQGYKVEREVVMTMADGPHHPAPAAEVLEPDEAAVLGVERRWLSEDERVRSADGVEQLLEAGLREGRAWGERRFGIAGDYDKLAAIAKLRSDGHIAQVEDVYTVPEARGRGFARTLVAHAVRVAQRAGHDVIFIVADDNDWPKHLYARLGFRPAGLRWALHRELTQ